MTAFPKCCSLSIAEFRCWLQILCFSLFATACADDPTPDAPKAPERAQVNVAAVEFEAERTRLEAVGTSRGIRSVTLYPESSGEVDVVAFDPGEFVEREKVLLELDPRDERLAVELAEVRLQDAELLYERYRKTEGTAAVLPTQLDSARTAAAAARIELARARVALDHRTVKAPFSGHVGLTDVDPGDRIGPNTQITTLDDRSVLLVSFAVPEALIGRLEVGSAVRVTTWTATDHAFDGRVMDIDSRIDPVSRTFLARAHVENSNDELRPGMSFRVVLELTGRTYPVVPEIAVQWGADGAFVWLAEEGIARRVPVGVVQRQQGRVLVDSVLKPGDIVVVEGVQRMREGLALGIQSRTDLLPAPGQLMPGESVGAHE